MMKIFRGTSFKYITAFLALNLLLEICGPVAVLALTSGPSQPEVQSFEPMGTTDMVDLFTGDFNYNIPLFELPGPDGGYPFNIAYHSGITMDQEASWVGLGWNLNPGAITRSMNGLPDEFDGDEMKITQDSKPNTTFGASGSINVELFGADFEKLKAGETGGRLALKLSIFHNNFRGVGYSVGAGLQAYGMAKDESTVNLGLDLTLDSQSGASISPSVSYTAVSGLDKNYFSLSGEVNSASGLDNVSVGYAGSWTGSKVDPKTGKSIKTLNAGVGATINQSNFLNVGKSHVVQTSLPWSGIGENLSFKAGSEVQGVFANGSIGGFIRTQELEDAKKEVSKPAYGYLNLHSGSRSDEDLMDFDRSNDGVIHKDMTNLAIPNLTYDSYNVSGQGVSALYRPYRSDVPVISDPFVRSNNVDISAGFEIGAGAGIKAGGPLKMTWSYSQSEKWEKNNDILEQSKYFYQGNKADDIDYEPYYFKSMGESTTDDVRDMSYIGEEHAIRFDLKKEGVVLGKRFRARTRFTRDDGSSLDGVIANENPTKTREARNEVIQRYSNSDLLDGGVEVLPEFTFDYYDITEPNETQNMEELQVSTVQMQEPQRYIRNHTESNHTGGFSALNPNGTRYIYGLPVYNTKQVNCLYTVGQLADPDAVEVDVHDNQFEKVKTDDDPGYVISGTNKFYSRTETPKYPHAFMLTAILGTDYVDSDGVPGPSDGDFGYWVKFEYAKSAEDYKWRAPFLGANNQAGLRASVEDNKGAYTYGEREQWYLASAQTKSHKAIFGLKKRHDAYGAQDEDVNNGKLDNLGNSNTMSKASYRLSDVKLFSKKELENKGLEARPIKTVHFQYSYDLCPGVQNNDGVNDAENSAAGKLTLKKLWFTHGNNTRGRLSPYVFDYNERFVQGEELPDGTLVTAAQDGQLNTLENPSYHGHLYDRWGNYKYDYSGDLDKDAELAKNLASNAHNPYVQQFHNSYETDETGLSSFEQQQQTNVAVWNLKSIKTPAGSTIDVEYESDDYAFVQDHKAMQMFNVAKFGTSGDANRLKTDKDNPGEDLKLYFDLEKPLLNTTSVDVLKDLYFDHRSKLLVKHLSYLRGPHDQFSTEELKSYVEIDKVNYTNDWCGFDDQVNGKYTRGWVRLKPFELGNKSIHPVQLAAWDFLKNFHPELSSVGGDLSKNSDNASEAAKKAKIRSLIGVFGSMKQIFTGFYRHARGKDWGVKVDLSRCYVRLCTPDKKKLGGGVRVKQIVLSDAWNEMAGEETNVYGQVYNYSTLKDIDGDGVLDEVSNGVASYEPFIGGDENPLRYVRSYTQKVPLGVDKNIDFEFPINESHFPGAKVGYSKVEVKSLATHYAGIANDPFEIPNSIYTTGKVVHEFYTSKDFPVITKQTGIDTKPAKALIPIPLLGTLSIGNMTASQGYAIVKNNMHGTPKQVSSYGQKADGTMYDQPYNWVRYEYQADEKYNDKTKNFYYELDNTVQTMTSLVDESTTTPTSIGLDERIIGRDYDYYVDMRENTAKTYVGGFHMNLDVIVLGPIVIPANIPWPDIGYNLNRSRSIVTNKVITKSGVLKKVVAFNEGSTITTENKIWDALTGQVVLSTVNNNFDNPVYNYKIPAHLAYDGMGAAYKNIGIRFPGQVSSVDEAGKFWLVNPQTEEQWENLIVPGDEFIMTVGSAHRKVMFVTGVNGYQFKVLSGGAYSTNPSGPTQASFLLTRSGRRNHLSATVGNVVALKDPTKDWGEPKVCDFPFEVSGIGSENRCVDDGERLEKVEELINDVLDYFKSDHSISSVSFTELKLEDGITDNPFYGRAAAADWNNFAGLIGKVELISYVSGGNVYEPGQIRHFNHYATFNEEGTQTGVLFPGFGVYDIYSITSLKLIPCSNRNDNQLSAIEYAGDPILSVTGDPYIVPVNVSYQPGTGSVSVPLSPTPENITRTFYEVDEVISTGAATFTQNEYRNWTPEATYTYLASRDQTAYDPTNYGADQIDLANDGTMDAVALFDWSNGLLTQCASNWKRTEFVTNHNTNTKATESENPLGIKSAVLYGHDGRLPIAVAANANKNEIAFENFEEYNVGNSVASASDLTDGNFEFFTQATTDEVLSITSYEVLSGNGRSLIINIPFEVAEKLSLEDKRVTINGAIIDSYSSKDISGEYKVVSIKPNDENPDQTLMLMDTDFPVQTVDESDPQVWKGFISIASSKVPFVHSDGSSITKEYSHSGKKSFKLDGGAANVNSILEGDQVRLMLSENKEYLISGWISVGESIGNQIAVLKDNASWRTSLASFNITQAPKVSLKFSYQNGTTNTIDLEPVGQVIDGWQKVETSFNMPKEVLSTKLRMTVATQSFSTYGWGNTTRLDSYFDDIRIQPAQSSMKTFVYNNESLLLEATLDDNNYASFYYYDDQGNLFLTKRETERGIKTIQESAVHGAETSQP